MGGIAAACAASRLRPNVTPAFARMRDQLQRFSESEVVFRGLLPVYTTEPLSRCILQSMFGRIIETLDKDVDIAHTSDLPVDLLRVL